MKVFGKPDAPDFYNLVGDLNGRQIGRCWAPVMGCDSEPIRAHSVQNSRILEQLHRNGQVVGIQSFLKSGEFHLAFKEIGRNKATTFRGLCSRHDQQLFEHIDSAPLDLSDGLTCDLLTWRAITHEMAEKMDMGGKIQRQYKSKITSGELEQDTVHPLGMEAIKWWMVLYEFHRYRQKYATPRNLLRGKNKMLHKRYVIPDTGAIIASSSFFVLSSKDGESGSHVAVNVFPKDGDSHVLISCCRDEVRYVMPFIRGLLDRKKLCPIKFSAFLLSRVQNIVISPNHFEAWDADKILAMELAFSLTAENENWITSDEILNLF